VLNYVGNEIYRSGILAGVHRPHLEEKRVRNELLKKELGVKFAFPTFREGLAAIHSGDMRPMEFL
jgi:hypothetical protein